MNKLDVAIFKQKAMQWASTFDVCCCLDSNQYQDPYSQYDCIIAAGHEFEISENVGNAFEKLKTFREQHKDWMFGLFSYELKNEIESLTSRHNDELHFPDLYFFVPKYILTIKNDEIQFIKGDVDLAEIHRIEIEEIEPTDLKINTKFDKETYLSTVQRLQDHIKRGDIYEVNFCQEFFANNAYIDPLATYLRLNSISPTPFSGFFKIRDQYILSATPERFLCKRDNILISQPIKGTAKRSINKIEDEAIKTQLKASIKEQAENVMIVDLVRNDLTKSAVKGSVKVDELFGIYTFPQVHQMISTITCKIQKGIDPIDAIKNTFPVGSMTGAPKIRAMELIDQYEKSKRGIFSGSFGCISPNGDFDFNVVIRTILYNAQTRYLSFQVGGAITYAAKPEDEYQECLLKASAILKVLKLELTD